jgi:glycosyltransferase involved in cell wall biosynthesis
LNVDLVIPALNEEHALPRLLPHIPRDLVRHVYVIDNGSTDDTARTAAAHGAIVLVEPHRGYGAACRRGAAEVAASSSPPDVVVFMHGDGSDDPQEIEQLVRPIERQGLDLVIGSRTLGTIDRGAMRFPDRLSRDVAVTLIRALYGTRFTDLGGFRAVRLPALASLGLSDDGVGFNVEMQVKAVKVGLRVAEVPVRHRRRSGDTRPHSIAKSAISSSKMLYTIFRHATTR